MAAPRWVRIGFAISAGLAAAAIYFGPRFPDVGFGLMGAVTIWNGAIAAYGYPSAPTAGE